MGGHSRQTCSDRTSGVLQFSATKVAEQLLREAAACRPVTQTTGWGEGQGLWPSSEDIKSPHVALLGFPGGSDGKESACNAGDPDLIPSSGRSPREGNGYPLQHSCLENSTGRGAWRASLWGQRELDTTEWLTLSCKNKVPPLFQEKWEQ